MANKTLYNFYGKSFLTFWLIFLKSCISIYPVKVSFFHNLSKVDSNINWETENQSLLFLKEEMILYFFNNKHQFRNEVDLKKVMGDSKDCKEKNDVLVNQFISFTKNKPQQFAKDYRNEFETYSFWLLNNCENYYIKENAKNILYWFSLNEEYNK